MLQEKELIWLPGNAAVKSTARIALRGFWIKAIVCTLILFATLFTAVLANEVFYHVFATGDQIISTVFNLLYLTFVFCPIALGILRFFWRNTATTGDDIGSVFYYLSDFNSYLKCIGFSVVLLFKISIVALISFLPLIAIKSVMGAPFINLNEQASLYLGFVSLIFSVLGWVFFLIFSVRYYLAPIMFVGCETLEKDEIFYLSKTVSRNTAGAFVVLLFGMFGWIVLTILGVTAVFTVPYILSAYAVHSRFAINYHNRNVKIANETDFPEYRSNF